MSIRNKEVNDRKVIGNLVLNSTNDRIPIVYGTNIEDLKQGAGYYKRSSWPGEMGSCIILGHRETVFQNLGDLKINDGISIQTLGKELFYKVTEIKIVDNINEIITTQIDYHRLILITCYPIKFCERIEKRYLVIAEVEE
ncbi:MAG: hypothetical protein APF84_10690 [Gracilibacter sp. BRH_c7a]|nr:MAG: hypothetical protein APF84_10690 [Gracilibacter sp. BRH_c7a]